MDEYHLMDNGKVVGSATITRRSKVDVQRVVDHVPLDHDDKFVWRVAQAIGEAYREYNGDSVSIVASVEMARAALKAIEGSSIGQDLPWGSF